MTRRLLYPMLFILWSFIIPGEIHSQTDSLKIISGNDSLNSGISKSPHTLYSGIGAGSNMIYLGTTISGNKPYGYGFLTYGFRDKLYLSASAVHISGMNPFAAFYSGSLIFTHTFNSWFDISGSISRYEVNSSLGDTLFSSFNYGDLSLGIDWRILYTKLNAGMLIGNGEGSYFQIRNSRYFETGEFSKRKATFSFDPYVNFLFGTITKAETTTGTTTVLIPPFRKGFSRTITTTTTEYYNEFALMELDMGLPVSLNFSKITFEAEAGYTYPLYDDDIYPGVKGFSLIISIFYKII